MEGLIAGPHFCGGVAPFCSHWTREGDQGGFVGRSVCDRRNNRSLH